MKNFLCCLTFSSGKTCFPHEDYSAFNWMRWPSPSICQSLDLEKETCWCDSCFPYKVYFLYIKHIWFALPKRTNKFITYKLACSASTAVGFEVKQFISLIFKQHRLLGEKKRTIPEFTRIKKCKGLQKLLKTVPKLVDCRTTRFYFVWRRRRHHDDKIY